MRIGIEIPEELVYMIDQQAKDDGHESRSAVIQKALVFFFAEKVAFVAKNRTENKIVHEKQCHLRMNPVPGLSKLTEVKHLQNVAKISESYSGEK